MWMLLLTQGGYLGNDKTMIKLAEEELDGKDTTAEEKEKRDNWNYQVHGFDDFVELTKKILEIIDETENIYLQGEDILNFKYNSRKYGNYRNTGEFHDGVAFVTGIK